VLVEALRVPVGVPIETLRLLNKMVLIRGPENAIEAVRVLQRP
jgi:hypothetical protein